MGDKPEPVWGIGWHSKLTGLVGRGLKLFTPYREEAVRVCDDLNRKWPGLDHVPLNMS